MFSKVVRERPTLTHFKFSVTVSIKELLILKRPCTLEWEAHPSPSVPP